LFKKNLNLSAFLDLLLILGAQQAPSKGISRVTRLIAKASSKTDEVAKTMLMQNLRGVQFFVNSARGNFQTPKQGKYSARVDSSVEVLKEQKSVTKAIKLLVTECFTMLML
jgi:hypothetical protein